MCDINDMIAELGIAKASQSKQINELSYIIEKSNSILLELENNHTTNKITSAPTLYAYSQETFQTFAKIVQKYTEFQSNEQKTDMENTISFDEYLHENGQIMKFLGSSVRKLLAINNIVAEMKSDVHDDESGSELSDLGIN